MTTAASSSVSVFGIRHHGPGSAHTLVRALEELRPDCILIEGPEDANGLVALAAHGEMKPPVALMVYDPEEPSRCVFFPFAEFSPEWQAIRFALAHDVQARFIDLPPRHWLAIEKAREGAEGSTDAPGDASDEGEEPWREDPLLALAVAAGMNDTERWWERLVEQRLDGNGVFGAIAEAMSAARAESGAGPTRHQERERLREAFMRTRIREASKDGCERIAVVCGAWHVPALNRLPAAKEDSAILKGLPKLKVESTWVPWTHAQLALRSGYGAGVEFPGWYAFLWEMRSRGIPPGRIAAHWLARVAATLRARDFDTSSGHLIEAVRLVDAICAMRGMSLPGLAEMDEAITSVLLFGDPTPLALIRQKLVVGEAMGEVPREAPIVPLQADLESQQKRLRLKPTADHRDLELDLRREVDLERSKLLHRLTLLGIRWGTTGAATGRGTFREVWRLQWAPDILVAVVSASMLGNTVESAAENRALQTARNARQLVEVTGLIEMVLLADLQRIIPPVMDRLGTMAAVSADIGQLLDAVAPLASALRYGNVRGAAIESIAPVFDSMISRACIGLPGACGSLDDDAASALAGRLGKVDGAITLVEREAIRAQWNGALAAVLQGAGVHGLVAGRACRLLLDAGGLTPEAAARSFSVALSQANDPSQAGAWVEGFLRGAGAILLHTDTIWNIVDDWVCALTPEAFTDMLPVLRRTFSTFEASERRMMGERVKRGGAGAALPAAAVMSSEVDIERANATLPVLALILGKGASA